jgi:hypothetical protein
MGAWGPGVFENDSALDWVGELDGGHAGSVAEHVRRTFAEAVGMDYVDVDQGSWVLAAAAVVASQLPSAPVELPESLAAVTLPVDDDLRGLAVRAVDRVLLPATSELAALWAGDTTFTSTADELRRTLSVNG